MSDATARRVLWISIVVGAVAGFFWGWSRWTALDIMTWNLMGLGVITTVAIATLVIAIGAVRTERRRRAEEKTGPAA